MTIDVHRQADVGMASKGLRYLRGIAELPEQADVAVSQGMKVGHVALIVAIKNVVPFQIAP